MEGIFQIFIETLFDFRRGLLRQVKWLDDTIEKLTALKEKGYEITEDDFAKFIKVEKKQPVVRPLDNTINPNICAHYFIKGSCEKCGIFEEIGGLMPVDQDTLRKAAEELEIERNKKTGDALGMPRINPSECEHPGGFKNGQCDRCSVYEEFANKSDTIEEADKPDK